MIDWIFERIGVVVFVIIVVVQIVRGVFRAQKDRQPQQSKPDELEEQRRVREIQDEIRRKIAGRRGGHVPEAPAPAPRETVPLPLPRPETTQMPEPFGGPLRRMIEELERKAQPAQPPPLRPATVQQRNAELERQEQLAEEMRLLEESRALVQRRAAQVAAERAQAAQTEGALRTAARGRLLAELHDPESLRRAFILREVLGPPVALR